MNLREARKKKKLDQFMRERDEGPTCDDASERFQRLTRRWREARTRESIRSKSGTSRKATSEDCTCTQTR
jgi:hypothetical protein